MGSFVSDASYLTKLLQKSLLLNQQLACEVGENTLVLVYHYHPPT